jgi:hypothetical protein
VSFKIFYIILLFKENEIYQELPSNLKLQGDENSVENLKFGGPNGELSAAIRYLYQRYSMPTGRAKGVLTDIGTEKLAHPLGDHRYHGLQTDERGKTRRNSQGRTGGLLCYLG